MMTSPDDNDISLTIDSLRLRFGSFGCERTKLINNIFKSFYDYAIPPYLRYLIYSSNNEKDVFNENDINGDENIINDANLNDIQMKNLLKFKKKMISSNQKLKTLILFYILIYIFTDFLHQLKKINKILLKKHRISKILLMN